VGLASDVLNYATEPAKSQRVGGVTDVGVAGRSSKEKKLTLTAPDVGLEDSIVTWPATPVLVKRSSHRFTVRVRVNSNLPDGTMLVFRSAFFEVGTSPLCDYYGTDRTVRMLVMSPVCIVCRYI